MRHVRVSAVATPPLTGMRRDDEALRKAEATLTAQLDAVRSARQQNHARDIALASYRPLLPDLRALAAVEEGIDPNVLAAVRSGRKVALRRLLKEEVGGGCLGFEAVRHLAPDVQVPGVFTLPLLRPEFCEQLVRESEHFATYQRAAQRGGDAPQEQAAGVAFFNTCACTCPSVAPSPHRASQRQS